MDDSIGIIAFGQAITSRKMTHNVSMVVFTLLMTTLDDNMIVDHFYLQFVGLELGDIHANLKAIFANGRNRSVLFGHMSWMISVTNQRTMMSSDIGCKP